MSSLEKLFFLKKFSYDILLNGYIPEFSYFHTQNIKFCLF